MQTYSTAPGAMFQSLWVNRSLVKSLIHREVVGRYRGSVMGIVWAFITPLFMLAIYTFVFSVVFKARWHGGSDSKTEFALVLFAGLMIFNLFSECLNRAPSLIVENVNYVKKVIFPLEILPWVALGSALFHASVSFLVWVIAYTILFGMPHVTILLAPLIVLPVLMLALGLAWALAALGVYLRDLSQFVALATSVLLFLSAVFFPASALPERYRGLLFLNPLNPSIEGFRDAVFWGKSPDWRIFVAIALIDALIAWVGFALFQRIRKGFADVL